MAAFNISLMDVESFIKTYQIQRVTKLNIFEPSTKNQFEPEGLFSEEIFGQIGSPDRLERLGYISLNMTAIHPILYHVITKLGSRYIDILEGKALAVWSKTEKDFILTTKDDPHGNTGYTFFLKHFQDIVFKKSDSDQREVNIEVFEKYKNKGGLITSCIVMPAGLRDAVIENGSVTKDAINDIYTSILGLANSLDGTDHDDPLFDNTRRQIQVKLQEHDEYMERLLSGKRGFLQGGGYSARKLTWGTRNVISSISTKDIYPVGPASLKPTEVMVGIYQASKGLTPVAKYWMQTLFFSPIFGDGDASSYPLIDPKTYQLSYVEVDTSEVQKFRSSDGLGDILSRFKNKDVRKQSVTITGKDGKQYPLLLVYDQGDKVSLARSVNDIKQVIGETFNLAYVRPLTWVELLYIATYRACAGRHATVTRYPVLEMGSSYPAKIHLRSTENSRIVEWYDLVAEQTTTSFPHYPSLEEPVNFIDSTIVHPSMLPGLGGDQVISPSL